MRGPRVERATRRFLVGMKLFVGGACLIAAVGCGGRTKKSSPTSRNQRLDRRGDLSHVRFSAWKALLALGPAPLRDFGGCAFATLPEHRNIHTFVASVIGAGVGAAADVTEPKSYGEPRYLLRLKCQSQAGSDRVFVCSLDAHGLQRTGDEHMGLSFQFDSSNSEINKESIKCFY